VKPTDSSRESTVDEAPKKRTLSKEGRALLMRLYSSPVHTAIVRLMGHDAWDEFHARVQLIRLMRRCGVEAVIGAAHELITISHDQQTPVARLNADVRQFAAGILGRPDPEGSDPPPALRRTPKVSEPAAPDDHTAPDYRLVAAPRVNVVERYAKHLWAQLLTYEVAKNASLPSEVGPLPSTVDFIVHRSDDHHLISVRKKLGKRTRAELHRLLSSLGQTWRAARIWPIESRQGWLWEYEWVNHLKNDPPRGE
jgi:hypothetical protein